jgi:hypothetical protein
VDWKKTSAAAMVAGGLFGTGDAQAQPLGTNLITNPSFEDAAGGAVTGWNGAIGTYLYSQFYTTNNIPPSAGLRYLHGPAAATGNTNQTVNLLTAGFSAAQLDSGLLRYNLSAWFSTYRTQNDNAAITLQFLNASSAPIGTSNTIGGQTFVSGLGRGPNQPGGPAGSLPDAADWGQDATNGLIPVGTRSVVVNIDHTRLAGNAADSYTDVLSFSLTAVPEPGTLVLTGAVAGLSIALRLYRRRPDEAAESDPAAG